MDSRTGQKKREDWVEQDANKIDLRNEIQEDYGRHPVPWFEWVFNALELPEGSQRSQILELGCGSGMLWQKNRARLAPGWNILLSDLTQDILTAAKANLGADSRTFRFLSVDSQSQPFTDESFDTVLGIGLLDLVPNVHQALSESWRVLRPSGQFVTTAGGRDHLHELEELVRPFLPPEKAENLGGDETHFGLENGRVLLSSYFEEVLRQDYRDQMTFTNEQPILDYVLSEQAILWALTVNQIGQFVQSLKRKLAERGEINVTIQKGIFVARKKVTVHQ